MLLVSTGLEVNMLGIRVWGYDVLHDSDITTSPNHVCMECPPI